MKKTLATFFLVAVGAVLSITAQAAPIVTVTQGLTLAGNDLFVFNVNPNGTVLDTIDITLTSTSGFAQTEMAPGVVLFSPAGTADDTDVLGLNTVALGWSILGTLDDVNNFAAAGGPLGSDIPNPLDFAQAVFLGNGIGSGEYTFNFADNGSLVGSVSGSFGNAVPEPSTLALGCISLLGAFVSRRRKS